jgi:1-aminocyclopropane-1-carboxylate deaminase/D-cysteine desulfhydrase-like pyridoxal-dependent ACC family enzyme
MNGAADEDEPLTRVERCGELWLKRDDLLEIGGVRGGKVRTCSVLARRARAGLVTASARASPQAVIVATLARLAGLPCRIHTAWGATTMELEKAAALGAELVTHRPGYNSVIVRRAFDDAGRRDWSLVPFGMECAEAVETSARQTENLPGGMARLVVPVGSGMTLAGVLHGLDRARRRVPVLGIVVGASPERRLDRWAPRGWRQSVTLIRSPLPYGRAPAQRSLHGVPLDPIYEAKCLPFLEPDDCLWIVGRR